MIKLMWTAGWLMDGENQISRTGPNSRKWFVQPLEKSSLKIRENDCSDDYTLCSWSSVSRG
jgi:hypothetical protein